MGPSLSWHSKEGLTYKEIIREKEQYLKSQHKNSKHHKKKKCFWDLAMISLIAWGAPSLGWKNIASFLLKMDTRVYKEDNFKLLHLH